MSGRTIIEQPRFSEEMMAITSGDAKRADDVLRGLNGLLCSEPSVGTMVPGTSFYTLAATRFCTPAMLFYYRFSDTHVWVESVREIDASE